MSDQVTRIGDSLVQQGSYNDRIYLMKLGDKDFPEIIRTIDELALLKGYSKVFAKIPGYAAEAFSAAGYITEARIPDFYRGTEDGLFMSKFMTRERSVDPRAEDIQGVLAAALSKGASEEPSPVSLAARLDKGYDCRVCSTSDAPQLAALYKKVFATYPFPIFDPDYIAYTMGHGVRYFSVWHQARPVALSSAEMDPESGNAEMTDFATLPNYRGKGFASALLAEMEGYIRSEDMPTVYTIARSLSYGMNMTFAKQGYSFAGTLVNNTNISGSLESMNVWYKKIRHRQSP